MAGRYSYLCRNAEEGLTYSMAWGNSSIGNFKKWKKTARAKVLECMMTPPKAAAAWDVEVLGEEQRDGYKAQKKPLISTPIPELRLIS